MRSVCSSNKVGEGSCTNHTSKANDATHVYRDGNGNCLPVADHLISSLSIINKTEINKTELIKVVRQKGGHLNYHYNSCLPSRFLIEHARNIKMMWIKSTTLLLTEEGKKKAAIHFQVQDLNLSLLHSLEILWQKIMSRGHGWDTRSS